MREELTRLESKRIKYSATFERFGKKSESGKRERTVVLSHVYAGSLLVADHVWVDYEPDLEIFGSLLHNGVRLEFTAIARPYRKDHSFRETGLSNQTLDMGLIEIRDVKIIPGI